MTQDADIGDSRRTLANVSHGDVTLPVREEVRVILEGGASKVCPLAPTP